MSSIIPSPALVKLCQVLDIDDKVLQQFMKIFLNEIKRGLNEKSADASSLKCDITYVQEVPNKRVRGKFLALDVAGIVFRVALVNIERGFYDMRAKAYTFPAHVTQGSGKKFFDYLAHCIHDFTTLHKLKKISLHLGFTFGFPVHHLDLKKGILRYWTKGFSCSQVEGQDIAEQLTAAIARKKGLLVDVSAVINDTTSALVSCAWKNTKCKMGLVVGAGANISYLEKVTRIKKTFNGDKSKPYVIINTEAGGFGSGGVIEFVRTDWDRQLDAQTNNPGVNICEKMVSSLYLGEVVRRILKTATTKGIIFGGKTTKQLKTTGTFSTMFISEVTKDGPGNHRSARAVLVDLGYSMPWAQDCVDLEFACLAAWQRAGRIVSAQVAALLNYMNFPDVVIALSGDLVRANPSFVDILVKKTRELTRSDIEFQYIPAEDSGGLGAALVAALATTDRGKMATSFSRVSKGR